MSKINNKNMIISLMLYLTIFQNMSELTKLVSLQKLHCCFQGIQKFVDLGKFLTIKTKNYTYLYTCLFVCLCMKVCNVVCNIDV